MSIATKLNLKLKGKIYDEISYARYDFFLNCHII